MRDFTYRSARAGSLVVGLGLAVVVEAAVLHLLLWTMHPVLAWSLTLSALCVLAWLATDYQALGRGTIRVGFDGVDLRVGWRVRFRVPLRNIATVVQPSWRDLPSTGGQENWDYRNLMKPATPNVLVTLTEAMNVRFFGAIARPVRRLGLRVDDPDGFVAAIDEARATASTPAI